jgi:uncharacterized membrane protein
LLASLLLASALLLTFLALLLTSAASKAADESLGLVGYSSYGALHSLGGLPYLVGNPSEGAALSLLTLLVLVSFAHLFSLQHSKNCRLVRSEPGNDAL